MSDIRGIARTHPSGRRLASSSTRSSDAALPPRRPRHRADELARDEPRRPHLQCLFGLRAIVILAVFSPDSVPSFQRIHCLTALSYCWILEGHKWVVLNITIFSVCLFHACHGVLSMSKKLSPATNPEAGQTHGHHLSFILVSS